MDIGFSKQRWADTKKNYGDWWNKKIDRPIVFGWYYDRAGHAGHRGASISVTQEMMYDENVSFESVLDGCEYEMYANQYFGDSYPYMHTAMSGPGAIAAYMGGRPVANSKGDIWFYPPENLPDDLSKVNLILDVNNKYYIRMKRFLEAATDRFSDQALVGMPDIGGNLDILSAFLDTENLLLALYDCPDEVKRMMWQAHEAWHRCFGAFSEILARQELGYSNWSFILSNEPFYMLQCDFSYMIGTDMFNEFVLPELTATAEKLDRTIYHMDGVQQFKHLDSVLGIEALDGVQLGPGVGKPPVCEFPDAIKKILNADKLLYYYGDLDGLEKIHKTFGKHINRMYIQFPDPITADNVDDTMRRLDRMGIGF